MTWEGAAPSTLRLLGHALQEIVFSLLAGAADEDSVGAKAAAVVHTLTA